MLAPQRENMMGKVLLSLQRRTLRRMCQILKKRKKEVGLDKMFATSMKRRPL
jgi:hypothetical protein